MHTRRISLFSSPPGGVRTGGALLAAAALLVSACSSGSATSSGGAVAEAALAPLPRAVPAALASYYGQKPSWRSCGVPASSAPR